MKCYGIVPIDKAPGFASASWLVLSSGSALLVQDTDYTAFTKDVGAVEGTTLPLFYDPTALPSAVLTALAPISIAPGSNMLQLITAAAALNPALSF